MWERVKNSKPVETHKEFLLKNVEDTQLGGHLEAFFFLVFGAGGLEKDLKGEKP